MSEGKEARTIIVAIDGSAEARNASAYALSLARDLGAKLCVLYVMDTHTARSLGLHLVEAIREMNQEGDRVVEGVVQQARQLGVEADGLLVEGKPGEEICKAAAARQISSPPPPDSSICPVR